MSEEKNKMWDGRFAKPTDKLMEEFNNSLSVDKIFIEEDIFGSVAWANALVGAGILSIEECAEIENGLGAILERYRKGELEGEFLPCDEDVHMAVERLLGEEIGDLAKKLHTGRSRNDQVATDFRLFVKKHCYALLEDLRAFMKSVFMRAVADKNIIIAGYTHYQQAQPVLLSHYWLSLFFVLEREFKKLEYAVFSADILPLGSGAIAGCGFSIDRFDLAEKLRFREPTRNSIDGVASRDFVLDCLHCLASVSINLSRYAEDLIVWSTKEFGYVELDDAWSTGSSMMPQKKNPDSLELIRGKTGRTIGNYTRFATTLKGIGLSYFKDLQEDKEPLIDSLKTVEMTLRVFSKVLDTLKINEKNIEKSLDPFLLATDVADYLVRKGMPFRQAHGVIGKTVAYCVKNNKKFNALSLSELQEFSTLFDEDVLEYFDFKNALKQRDIYGAAGPSSVEAQLEYAKAFFE